MKRIVTIQDISCVGKCSLTVALPIISAMGVEAAIIPTAVVFAFVQLHIKRKEAAAASADGSELKANFSIRKIFPWFILGFLAMSLVASLVAIPAEVVTTTKSVSKFLMVCALAAIGLNTSFSKMKKSGIRPMIHGFIISALVVIVALLVEVAMGIV